MIRAVLLSCGALGLGIVFSFGGACLSPPDRVDPLSAGEFHMTTTFSQRVDCVLETTVTLFGGVRGSVDVYAPAPPLLPTQLPLVRELKLTTEAEHYYTQARDESTLRRDVLALRVGVDAGKGNVKLELRTMYKIDLYAQHLANGKGDCPPVPLDANMRLAYLSPAEHMDFDKASFQAWVKNTRLARACGERDLAFAHRVFRYLTDHATYAEAGDYDSRKPSAVCVTLKSDCGGLSMLFVAVLRASGVPARTLFGRWALSQEGAYGQYHVIAEFYAANVGWVPVDVARAIVHCPEAPDSMFGHTDGLFVAFHEDTDLRITPDFVVPWAQYLLFRWPGTIEVSDSWQVTSE